MAHPPFDPANRERFYLDHHITLNETPLGLRIELTAPEISTDGAPHLSIAMPISSEGLGTWDPDKFLYVSLRMLDEPEWWTQEAADA